MNNPTANYDESWKESLNEYFDAFLDFFFPVIYQQIDWTKIPQALDKELLPGDNSLIDYPAKEYDRAFEIASDVINEDFTARYNLKNLDWA
jgi:hypothetical protein